MIVTNDLILSKRRWSDGLRSHKRIANPYYCCLGESAEGAKDYRLGCKPPVQGHQQNKNPKGVTEHLSCLVSTLR